MKTLAVADNRRTDTRGAIERVLLGPASRWRWLKVAASFGVIAVVPFIAPRVTATSPAPMLAFPLLNAFYLARRERLQGRSRDVQRVVFVVCWIEYLVLFAYVLVASSAFGPPLGASLLPSVLRQVMPGDIPIWIVAVVLTSFALLSYRSMDRQDGDDRQATTSKA